MTTPTEQMLREIKERLSANRKSVYENHGVTDLDDRKATEMLAHAPEDLAKLIQIVEVLTKAAQDGISIAFMWTQTSDVLNEALSKADAIAKGSE